jgi:hypothetical protein
MQSVLAFSQHAWPPILIFFAWWILRTRLVRTAAWVWLLRRQGVSEAKRHKLITDAAQRDLVDHESNSPFDLQPTRSPSSGHD